MNSGFGPRTLGWWLSIKAKVGRKARVNSPLRCTLHNVHNFDTILEPRTFVQMGEICIPALIVAFIYWFCLAFSFTIWQFWLTSPSMFFQVHCLLNVLHVKTHSCGPKHSKCGTAFIPVWSNQRSMNQVKNFTEECPVRLRRGVTCTTNCASTPARYTP